MPKQVEIEKAGKRGMEEGNKEAKISVAEKLIKSDFQDEQISELTGLLLNEIIELRKSLQDLFAK